MNEFLIALYTKPWRIYLLVALLSGLGVWAGLSLPISLYPNTNRPSLNVSLSYGNLNATEFRKVYGQTIEAVVRNFSADEIVVDSVESDYGQSSVRHNVQFGWGQQGDKARDLLNSRLVSVVSAWPQEIRESLNVSTRGNGQGGFLAASFYSSERPISEVYELLHAAITPRIAAIPEIGEFWMQNPDFKQVKVLLKPEALISSGVSPWTVEETLKNALQGLRGGNLQVGEKSLSIEVPAAIDDIDDIAKLSVPLQGAKFVTLSELADVQWQRNENETIFKTEGRRSLILFANPKPGSNVKKMAEDIVSAIGDVMPLLPPDIKMKMLVDPSAFIRASVKNVLKEIVIGAGLASIILFLFIGSFRNVATAAIEIPVSLVLAFLLMKISGMSINLISLGGLALSAGMNVDASVVVMENIFRKFEEWRGQFDFETRVRLVIEAVKEVWIPVFSATFASLVVFLPLIFTKNLSYAVLGDLAKAVIFSHGFSCFVALLLVPTVRLHLMSKSSQVNVPQSPLEFFWTRLEKIYANVLRFFVLRTKVVWLTLGTVFAAVAALGYFIVPSLPKEVVGLPESDFLVIRMNPQSFIPQKQWEEMIDGFDAQVKEILGDKMDYSFIQIFPMGGMSLTKVKNKNLLDVSIKELEKKLSDTPDVRFRIQPWNPSELPIPNPPQLEINVTQGTAAEQLIVANDVTQWLEGSRLFPRVYSDTDFDIGAKILRWEPHTEIFAALNQSKQLSSAGGGFLRPVDLMRFVSLVSSPLAVGAFQKENTSYAVSLALPETLFRNLQELNAIPVRIGERVIPLAALGEVTAKAAPAPIMLKNGEQTLAIYARFGKGDEREGRLALAKAKAQFAEWKADREGQWPSKVRVDFVDSEKEVTAAIDELMIALAWSVALIALILLLQFGSIAEALIVLLAIPLGLIGVFVSLHVFKSTFSLNSVLGIILLNGLSVGNSIILVDLMNRLHSSGAKPVEAACQAAQKRLRPILITSLTTILAMVPIALGAGEGGKILQPLGISVAGGLWVSMMLTLFLVPGLHAALLSMREAKRVRPHSSRTGLQHIEQQTKLVGKTLGAVLVFLLPPDSILYLAKIETRTLHLQSIAQADEPSSQLSQTGVHGGATVAFSDWLESLVRRSPEVERSRAALTVALAGRSSTLEGFLPEINGTGELSRSLQSSPPTATGVSSVSAGLQAQINLFAGGLDAARSQSQEREIRKAESELDHAHQIAAKRIALEFWEAADLKEQLRQLENRKLMYERQNRLSEVRFKRGQLSKSEFDKVKRGLVSLEIQEKEIADALRLKLRELFASDAELEDLLRSTGFHTGQILGSAGIESRDLDYGQHPMVKSSALEVEKQRFEQKAAESRSMPRLDFILSSSEVWPIDPKQQHYNLSALSFNLDWKLYDKGQRWKDTERLISLSKAADSEKNLALEQLKRDHTSEASRRAILKAKIALQLKLLASVRTALAESEERFALGRLTLLELLDDARELWQFELELIESKIELQKSWTRLCYLKNLSIHQCWKANNS